jgi:hypothetical protein
MAEDFGFDTNLMRFVAGAVALFALDERRT